VIIPYRDGEAGDTVLLVIVRSTVKGAGSLPQSPVTINSCTVQYLPNIRRSARAGLRHYASHQHFLGMPRANVQAIP
jgi:hypothetical protein